MKLCGKKVGDTVRYCNNINCETPEEPIERISDYRIIDGAVICVACYEADEEQREWDSHNSELAESDTVSRILWDRR